MNILIFIEHDIIIRHFVSSGIFEELSKAHCVHFVFPQVDYKRVKNTDFSKLALNAPRLHLKVHQERLVIWQKLFQVSRLRWQPGKHFAVLRKFQRYAINSFQAEWLKNSIFYNILAFPGVYSFFRNRQLHKLKKMPNQDLQSLIDEYKPDVLIHPSVLSGVFIDDLVVASREYAVPLLVIMNSWDNPSTKYSAMGVPDWLLVWGEQTKQDAIKYIKALPERTIEFGAAQFEVHRSDARISRDDFCHLHCIDPNSKLLLYAGSSKETDEFAHLLAIEQAIQDGILVNVAVVYRPHPWGGCGKDGYRILDYPWQHISLESTMLEYLNQVKAGTAVQSLPDYRHTHDVLSSIDALISPLSTIILEGALHGKPVMCYMPDEEEDAHHFQMAAPMVHFEGMLDCPEIVIGRGRKELIPKLVELIAKIEEEGIAERLKNACSYFVKPFNESYGKRLLKFVNTTFS